MVKSKGWLTSTQLLSDPDVPFRTFNAISAKLKRFMLDFPDDVRALPVGNGDMVTYQLRPEAKERFIKYNTEWMSPYDIAADADFGIANPTTARTRLIAMMDKMPGKIREKPYGKTVSYELLRSAKGEFISLSQDILRRRRRVATKNINTEWLSTTVLARDPDVPSIQPADIGKKLKEMYKLMPGKIKREPYQNTYKYRLHFSAKTEFIERAFSRSRKRGLASLDLAKDPDVPHNSPSVINKRMAAVFDQMQGKMWREPHRGSYAYFLDPAARDEFIALAYPKKAEKEWLSAGDLARDPDVPRSTQLGINKALMEMMEYMPGKIRNDMGKRAGQYCVHVSAKAEFLEKAYGVKIRPHESTKEPHQDAKDKQDIFKSGKAKFVQWVVTNTANLGRFFSSSTDEYS